MNNQKISFVAVGDICLGDHYFSLGHGTARNCNAEKTLGISEEVLSTLQSFDFAFCNIECPLSRVSDRSSKVEQTAFRGHPDFARLISEAGFSVASIANNHICQHGPKAFDDTVSALQGQSIKSIGLVADTGRYSSIPYITTIRGISVGFIGYSLVTERYMPRQRKYAAPTRQQIIQDTKELAREVNVVVVSVHGGEEGVMLPSPLIISFFREIVEAGATVVLGHHPHVFQPVERWKRGLIVYSLGDFIFDLFWDRLLVESAVMRIDIFPDNNFACKTIPVVMKSDYTVGLLHGAEKKDFFERVERASLLIRELDNTVYENKFMQHMAVAKRGEVFSKGGYFLRNFMKGNTLLKTQFVAEKLKKKIQHCLS